MEQAEISEVKNVSKLVMVVVLFLTISTMYGCGESPEERKKRLDRIEKQRVEEAARYKRAEELGITEKELRVMEIEYGRLCEERFKGGNVSGATILFYYERTQKSCPEVMR